MAGRRDFSAMTIAGIAVKVLTIASGPLVARMLGPQARGELATVVIISVMCSQLGTSGLPVAIAHTVAKARAPARDVLAGFQRMWLLLILLTAASAAGVTSIFLRGHDQIAAFTIATFVLTLLTAGTNLLIGMLQGEGSVRHINAVRIYGLVAYVSMIVAIFFVHRTNEAVVVAVVLVVAQFAAFTVGWMRLRPATGDPSVRASRQQVHGFARRSYLSNVGILDGLSLDQLIVAVVLGQASLGLYAVAVSIANLPLHILAGFALLLLPRMSALPAREATLVMRRWVLASIGLTVVLVVGLEIVVGPAMRVFFGNEFAPGIASARILVLSWALLGLRRVLTAAAQAQGSSRRASIIEVGSAIVLVVGVWAGSQHSGLEGAAMAVVIAAAVSCVSLASVVRWRVPNEDSVGDVGAEASRQ